jgi:hypothetical protein
VFPSDIYFKDISNRDNPTDEGGERHYYPWFATGPASSAQTGSWLLPWPELLTSVDHPQPLL